MTSALPPPPQRPLPPPVVAPALVATRPIHRGVFIGAGLVVLGVIVAGIWIASRVSGVSDHIDRFERSSEENARRFEVSETVDWTLFVEPSMASLSGVRFAVIDVDTGEEIALGRSTGSTTYAWFGRSGRSVGRVELAPGEYLLQVEGPVTIAIGESPGRLILWAFGGAALLGLPLIIGGVTIGVVGAVRDTRRRTKEREPPPASPWSAGEWPADRGR